MTARGRSRPDALPLTTMRTPTFDRMDPRVLRGVGFAALASLVALGFGPALSGSFVWDDHTLIEQNLYAHSLSWLPRLWRSSFWDTSSRGVEVLAVQYFRPVVSTAYALVWQLGGGSARAYHLVNLALHTVNAGLGVRWLRERVPNASLEALLACGALLAVHPTRAESVAWISGSPDLWLTLFALLAALAKTPARAALFAALALCSKENAVAIPALLAVDAWAMTDDTARRSTLRRAGAALAAIAVVFAWRLAWVPLTASAGVRHAPLAHHVERVLGSLGLLTSRVVWPHPLGFGFAELPFDTKGLLIVPAWSVALGALVALASLALTALAWRRPSSRVWLADAAWALLPVAPALNVVPRQMVDLVSDRMVYTALLGVAALALRAMSSQGARGRYLAMALCVPVALGAVTARRHARVFSDDATLWRHESEAFSDRLRGVLAEAQLEVARGDFAAALPLIGRGLATATRVHSRDGQIDLSMLAARVALSRVPELDQPSLSRVRAFYDAVVDPTLPLARLDAGGLHLSLQMRAGEPEVLRSLPDSWMHPRALAALRTQDFADAARRYAELVARSPTDAEAQMGLARSMAALARWSDALTAAETASRLSPAGALLRRAFDDPACVRARNATDDATAHAQCFVRLSMWERARVVVRSQGLPSPTAALVEVMLEADLAEGLFDRARERVARAGQRFADHAARWQSLVRAAESAARR